MEKGRQARREGGGEGEREGGEDYTLLKPSLHF